MESIKLFSLCEQMKWAHLPVEGGLYAQSPELLDQFRQIFSARNEHQAEEEAKRERERSKASPKGNQGGRPRRPARHR